VSVALSLLETFPTLPGTALAADRYGVRPQELAADLRLPPAIRLRSLATGDRDAVIRTVARCTPETRHARFHEPLSALPLGWARSMCTVTGGRVAVAAVVESIEHRLAEEPAISLGAPYDDEVVAMVHIEPEFGHGELAILVEDSYQRSGIGIVLVCAALSEAARNGMRHVQCHLLPGNQGIRRLLSSLGLPVTRRHDDGKECWTIDIRGVHGEGSTAVA
jgi:GNAT superfamily N-acetyltransferase